jgi:segregation and condensation protein B
MGFPVAERAKHLVALLFAGASTLDTDTAARILEIQRSELAEVLGFLREHPPLGLQLQRSGEQMELVSDPDSAPFVEKLLGLDRPVKLSRAGMETLSIVAYRQPVTRGDVESIRGVNSDSAMTTLLNRGLIAEAGRRETVGHPALYGTTAEFLQHLGIDSLDALPPIEAGYPLPTR